MIEKEITYQKLTKENPNKYPKNVIPVHIINNEKAITIWDVDNTQQITNKLIYMMPEGKATIVPIIESETFIKSYKQTKTNPSLSV